MRILEMFLQFGLGLAELFVRTGLQLLVAVLTAAGKGLIALIGHLANGRPKAGRMPRKHEHRPRRRRRQWQHKR